MGIPKFYRWTSERYPCLSRTIKDNEVRPMACRVTLILFVVLLLC